MLMLLFGILVVGGVLLALGEGLETGTKKLTEGNETETENPDEGWQPINGENDPPEGDVDDTEVAYLVPGTYPIPDGEVTISVDGSFSGERVETNDYGGAAPSTEDRTSISGQISASGRISGQFTGTDTTVLIDGDRYEYTIDQVSGTINGQLQADGSYSLQWTGPEPGSQAGQLPRGNISEIFAGLLLNPTLSGRV